jgi:hypothetical protein
MKFRFFNHRSKKDVKQIEIVAKQDKIKKPVVIEPLIAPIPEPPKVEEIVDTSFRTTDVKLVSALQDKFNVREVYYDDNNKGIKTFVFYADKTEVEKFLKEAT